MKIIVKVDIKPITITNCSNLCDFYEEGECNLFLKILGQDREKLNSYRCDECKEALISEIENS